MQFFRVPNDQNPTRSPARRKGCPFLISGCSHTTHKPSVTLCLFCFLNHHYIRFFQSQKVFHHPSLFPWTQPPGIPTDYLHGLNTRTLILQTSSNSSHKPLEHLLFLLEYTFISRVFKTSRTFAIFLGEIPYIWNSPDGEPAKTPWLTVAWLGGGFVLGINGLTISINWLG